MKIVKPKATISVRKVTNKKPIYQSDIDPAQVIHSYKTHRSVDEAFRTANYATPIWRCENDWDRTVEIFKWIAVWCFTLGIFYVFALGFEKWMSL